MRLDDAEQAKYEALAEAAQVAIEPIVQVADTAVSANVVNAHDFEHALDQSVLAIMDLVDKAYKQGRHDNNQEWLETEWAHLQQ